MATIVRRETRKRGFFGWIFLLIFLAWNLLLAYAFLAGLSNVATSNGPTDAASRAGAAIGTTIGAGLILGIWAAGALITGLFALLFRGSKVIVEETRR